MFVTVAAPAHVLADAEQNDVHFSLHQSTDRASPNALWQVQSPTGLNFDTVNQGHRYCLQHIASGGYLTVASASSTKFARTAAAAEKAEEEGEEGVATTAHSMPNFETVVSVATQNQNEEDTKEKKRAFLRFTAKMEAKAAKEEERKAAAQAVEMTQAQEHETVTGKGRASAAFAPSAAVPFDDMVLCVKPLGPQGPDLFELHDCHLVTKPLHTSSLIRLKHVHSGWSVAVTHSRSVASCPPMSGCAHLLLS